LVITQLEAKVEFTKKNEEEFRKQLNEQREEMEELMTNMMER
jgi:hypothetical protein